MIKLRLDTILKEKNISRYKLQFLTNINYPRITKLYNNTAANITFEELDVLTRVLDCSISDLFEVM